jgi:N-[(2S)-2-amino-2-carboxyethyl]-L-glutamate dehydrogenase
MLYINTSDLNQIGTDWENLILQIKKAVKTLNDSDFSQPIKPYLRFIKPQNRIIAMPAYVGGEINCAGIKWIASFPDNLKSNIQRAHSVTIINDPENGIPLCIINSATVSEIRTASVSGLIIQEYLKIIQNESLLTVGVIGLGPIGKMHLKMIDSMYGDKIKQYNVYDIRTIEIDDLPPSILNKIVRCNDWKEAFENADIFVTCTVTTERYIDCKPKSGSLQLNVSLRDYHSHFKNYVDCMVVDDWDEICRENTDIERMHIECGLNKFDTVSIIDVVCNNAFEKLDDNSIIMFNPMGMAVFDLAIGEHYYRKGIENKIGTYIND